MVKFSLTRAECLTLTLSIAGCDPCQYRRKRYIAKTRFCGLHFRCRKYCVYLQPLLRNPPRATEFGEIKLSLGLLRRSRSFKVTEFGTNRKLICDFLLVINTNLAPILHHFRDIAFDRSKIAIPVFHYPSCVYLPRWRGSPGTISVKFYLDVTRWPRYQWCRNIVENFNCLSRVHKRYRRQTDGQTEFTFAKSCSR